MHLRKFIILLSMIAFPSWNMLSAQEPTALDKTITELRNQGLGENHPIIKGLRAQQAAQSKHKEQYPELQKSLAAVIDLRTRLDELQSDYEIKKRELEIRLKNAEDALKKQVNETK